MTTPCRVSIDELAHDIAQMAAADEICDRCGAQLFGNRRNPKWQPSDENWLVCPCGNALCEECRITIREAADESGFRKWLDPETVQNEGFCSPGCMAKRLDAINWGHRKSRLALHCEAAQRDLDRTARMQDNDAVAALKVGLFFLISRVRGVCK